MGTNALKRDQQIFINAANAIINGGLPDTKIYETIAHFPAHQAFDLLPGANLLREHFWGNRIHLCTICNAKSGRCSEDCRFCAQSSHHRTDAPTYPLMAEETLVSTGGQVAKEPVDRFSIVTTGRGLGTEEVRQVAASLKKITQFGIHTCASLGIISDGALEALKNAGVGRYHHNLETARSYFTSTCTTHAFQDRVETIRRAKALGLSICAGGVFGIGETDDQVLELALELKALDVDAVPLNFLVPIAGTPLERTTQRSPLECLKIIALFRYVMPEKEIIICGGREANLKQLHPLVFYAGASGIMTGNYLTATGRSIDSDLDLISQLGLEARNRRT